MNDKMPIYFFSHGSPMNIIEQTSFSNTLDTLAHTMPQPKAIIMISAHWVTQGSKLSRVEQPKQIYDFYGFPPELYQVTYHPLGAPSLATHIKERIPTIEWDASWGLDHGAWSVLFRLYPKANIPVIQLSIDQNKTLAEHIAFAKQLSFLRSEGVLIIGSGNIIHSFQYANPLRDAPAYDWAIETHQLLLNAIREHRHQDLIDYQTLHPNASRAFQTLEHYIPALYISALSEQEDQYECLHTSFQHASMSMSCFVWKQQEVFHEI
ncbi:MAG: DODA-type extradiol aromatic ring-opening family dioxygenase [Erysipelotrichaceae bacterium]